MCTVEAVTVRVMFRHCFTLLGVIGTLIGVLFVNCLYFNYLIYAYYFLKSLFTTIYH